MYNTFVVILFLNTIAVNTEPSRTIFTTIVNSDSSEFDVSYPNNVPGERALPECVPNAACSVLHKRFWFKIKLERLCRCPNRYECPRVWSDEHEDNNTLMLNNRSQLKFCQSVTTLATCIPRQPAMTVTTNSSLVTGSYNQTELITEVSAVTSCYCPPYNYWKLHRHTQNTNATISIYRCVKLRKCNTNDFCGHIRGDHFSAYYQCSCPIGHWCIFTDHRQYNAAELLYNGPAYKGVCYFYQ